MLRYIVLQQPQLIIRKIKISCWIYTHFKIVFKRKLLLTTEVYNIIKAIGTCSSKRLSHLLITTAYQRWRNKMLFKHLNMSMFESPPSWLVKLQAPVNRCRDALEKRKVLIKNGFWRSVGFLMDFQMRGCRLIALFLISLQIPIPFKNKQKMFFLFL